MNFNYELKFFDNSFLSERVIYIAGIDEAGRGPLAGPVVAASVLFSRDFFINGVDDSKKLSYNKRNELYKIIISSAVSYGIGIINNEEIDRINILQATLKAMRIAADQIIPVPDLILVDGNKAFPHKCPLKTIVKGDSKSFAIAAASIIAKVTRDQIMEEAAEIHPQYGWHKNMGYPTKMHRNAILEHGPSPLHRKTFLKKLIPEESLLF